MASPETLQINAINATWAGASGAATDIDEVIGSPDTAYYGAGANADAADFGFGASEVVDGDTVTNISFNMIYRDDGTAGTVTVDVDLLIGGVVQGTTQTITVSGSDTTYSNINDTGWNVDRTAAEMDGAELRLTPTQSGMPGTNAGYLETANMVVTFTSTSPAYDQKSFRGYEDSAAASDVLTAIAAENTNFSVPVDTPFHIRFEIEETGGAGEVSKQFRSERQINAGGWANVDNASTGIFMQLTPACTETNGANPVGNILTTSTATFDTSFYINNSGVITHTMIANNHIEYQISVELNSADVSPGDTIKVKVNNAADSSDLEAYTNLLTITVAGAGNPPAYMHHFKQMANN